MAMKHDLDGLSLDELKRLAGDIEKAIRKTETENLKKAREAAEVAVQRFGYSLADIMGRARAPRAKEPEAKYRNPENESQSWSGRGRQPQWFKDAIAGGRSPEDLAA